MFNSIKQKLKDTKEKMHTTHGKRTPGSSPPATPVEVPYPGTAFDETALDKLGVDADRSGGRHAGQATGGAAASGGAERPPTPDLQPAQPRTVPMDASIAAVPLGSAGLRAGNAPQQASGRGAEEELPSPPPLLAKAVNPATGMVTPTLGREAPPPMMRGGGIMPVVGREAPPPVTQKPDLLDLDAPAPAARKPEVDIKTQHALVHPTSKELVEGGQGMTGEAAPLSGGTAALPSSQDLGPDSAKPELDDGLMGHSVPRTTQESASAKPRIEASGLGTAKPRVTDVGAGDGGLLGSGRAVKDGSEQDVGPAVEKYFGDTLNKLTPAAGGEDNPPASSAGATPTTWEKVTAPVAAAAASVSQAVQDAASKTAGYGQAACGKVAGTTASSPGATAAHTAPLGSRPDGGDDFKSPSTGVDAGAPPAAHTAPKSGGGEVGVEPTRNADAGNASAPPVKERLVGYATAATEQMKTAMAVAGGTVAGTAAAVADRARELAAPHVETVQAHSQRLAGQATEYGRSTQDAVREKAAQLHSASREQAAAAYQAAGEGLASGREYAGQLAAQGQQHAAVLAAQAQDQAAALLQQAQDKAQDQAGVLLQQAQDKAAEVAADETNRANAARVAIALLLLLLASWLTGIPLKLALALTVAAGIAAVLAQLQQARREAPRSTVCQARHNPPPGFVTPYDAANSDPTANLGGSGTTAGSKAVRCPASADDAAAGRILTATSGAAANWDHPDVARSNAAASGPSAGGARASVASPTDAALGKVPTATSGAVVNRDHPDHLHAPGAQREGVRPLASQALGVQGAGGPSFEMSGPHGPQGGGAPCAMREPSFGEDLKGSSGFPGFASGAGDRLAHPTSAEIMGGSGEKGDKASETSGRNANEAYKPGFMTEEGDKLAYPTSAELMGSSGGGEGPRGGVGGGQGVAPGAGLGEEAAGKLREWTHGAHEDVPSKGPSFGQPADAYRSTLDAPAGRLPHGQGHVEAAGGREPMTITAADVLEKGAL